MQANPNFNGFLVKRWRDAVINSGDKLRPLLVCSRLQTSAAAYWTSLKILKILPEEHKFA